MLILTYVCICVVSHKKLMLMRWEKSVFDETSLPPSPPPSPHTSQPATLTAGEMTGRRGSPLFEELSDNEEFEDTKKNADTAEERGI